MIRPMKDIDLVIQVLHSVREDLVALGAYQIYSFDDEDARALDSLTPNLTHKQKFFRANARINQVSLLILKLQRSKTNNQDHEF